MSQNPPPWDLPWLKPRVSIPKFGFRANFFQILLISLITVLIGASLQFAKLSGADSAARTFSQSSYSSKVSFLVPFSFSKAVSNLAVGFLADRFGRKWMQVGTQERSLIESPSLFSYRRYSRAVVDHAHICFASLSYTYCRSVVGSPSCCPCPWSSACPLTPPPGS